MTTLKVALVGYGWWGASAYAPAIFNDGRAEIIAVCARSQLTLDKAQKELPSAFTGYTDLEKMLAEEQLDAVFLAVPDVHHETYLRQIINAGMAIFYEPPLSHIADRIPAMLTDLLAAKQLLHGDTELVYAPIFEKAVECAKSGEIGQIHHIDFRLNSNWGPITDSGLSLINNIAPWYFDVICRVINQLPERVMVLEDQNYIDNKTQNQSVAMLDFGNISATFRANIAAAVATDETILTVYGSKGEFTANYFTGEFTIRTKSDHQWRSEQIEPILPIAGWPGIHESIQDFFTALIQGTQTRNNPFRMAQLCAAGQAAEQSRHHRNWVTVTYPQAADTTV